MYFPLYYKALSLTFYSLWPWGGGLFIILTIDIPHIQIKLAFITVLIESLDLGTNKEMPGGNSIYSFILVIV